MNQHECALRTALDVHEGQLDKGGSPYILHPIRVMMQMETEPERVVALLHDSVEDGDEFDLAQVEAKFGGKIASAVEAITKRENEPYQTYLGRVKSDAIATKVKLADIKDNSDIMRLGRALDDKDRVRLEKYRLARMFLEA